MPQVETVSSDGYVLQRDARGRAFLPAAAAAEMAAELDRQGFEVDVRPVNRVLRQVFARPAMRETTAELPPRTFRPEGPPLARIYDLSGETPADSEAFMARIKQHYEAAHAAVERRFNDSPDDVMDEAIALLSRHATLSSDDVERYGIDVIAEAVGVDGIRYYGDGDLPGSPSAELIFRLAPPVSGRPPAVAKPATDAGVGALCEVEKEITRAPVGGRVQVGADIYVRTAQFKPWRHEATGEEIAMAALLNRARALREAGARACAPEGAESMPTDALPITPLAAATAGDRGNWSLFWRTWWSAAGALGTASVGYVGYMEFLRMWNAAEGAALLGWTLFVVATAAMAAFGVLALRPFISARNVPALSLAVVAVLLFGFFVWPTPFFYYPPPGRQHEVIRVNRITGEVHYLTERSGR